MKAGPRAAHQERLHLVHVDAGLRVGRDGQDLHLLALDRQLDAVVDRLLEDDLGARIDEQAAEQVHGLLRAGGEEDLLRPAPDPAHRHQLHDLRLERLQRGRVLQRSGVGGEQVRGGLGQRGHGEQVRGRQAHGEGEDARPRGQLHDLAQAGELDLRHGAGEAQLHGLGQGRGLRARPGS